VYNFYCIGGDKYGCDSFTEGSNGKLVSAEEALESDPSIPLCWAGSHKEVLYYHCLEKNRSFFNLDTGYFGNTKRKEIIRVSINNFQNCNPITNRSSDRWANLNIPTTSLSRGSTIVLVPPDPKICKSFRLGSEDEWIESTIKEIKNYTDRPIRIRHRPSSRNDRLINDTFLNFLADNTWCVVGWSSNALTEAVIADIPVIALGHSATKSLYSHKLSDIESINTVNSELKQSWINHLSYSQFTLEELRSGQAWKLLSA
jgi:hypothetical protein